MHGGNAPDVEFTINDNSDAMLATHENKFPGTWHVNCFAHLTCVNVPKHKKHLNLGVDVDEIVKCLVDIRNFNKCDVEMKLFLSLRKNTNFRKNF